MEEIVSGSAEEWAGLAPELFGLVLQRVQKGREEAGEGRRVVSLAGVCQQWRRFVQEGCSAPLVETGLLQFPADLLQPGPIHSPVQCLLKRKRNGVVLYHAPAGADKRREFLMAARRIWHPLGSRYIISRDRKKFSTAAPSYLGKLKSNFWRSDFFLSRPKSELGSDDVDDALVKIKTFSARIQYAEHIVNGIRQRRISCSLPQPSKDPGSNVPDIFCQSPLISNSFQSWFRWNCISPVLDYERAYSSFRNMHRQPERRYSVNGVIADSQNESSEVNVRRNTSVPLDLRSKVPAWDMHQRCWSLDFKGRASMPSMHNFQIISASSSSSEDQSTTSSEEIIVLQVGKIGKRLYTLDFCYPLSAFQAFAICLSSFATNVGLER
ncbi:hypothetical protein O6H91_13G026400 [Diphasiastrum complanatum]|uniref:Uncharacterized protein n=1 Tax=Diphasiastrum complanatum TaxID=34168 RepID=A0ACC2BT50_DIPCM|nr:hypothetical protein O6H91_13G026400 [Diphasiastrum complanatum]